MAKETLSRFHLQFHSDITENAYRQHFLPVDVTQNKIAILIFILPTVLFSYSDYLLFGTNETFYSLTFVRLFEVALSLLFYYVISTTKNINDQFGHDIGDIALKKFANLLKSHTRKIDVLGRFGGEEFVLLLPETNMKDAENIVQRIIKDCQSITVKTSTTDCNFTVSAGLTLVVPSENTVIKIIKRADTALYHAKNKGRNQYQMA